MIGQSVDDVHESTDDAGTVHVGTIYHVGHDKHALAAALSKIGAIDQHCCVVPPDTKEGFPAESQCCVDESAGQVEDPIARLEMVPGELGAQLEILWRICARGRRYFAEKHDSHGTDLFQHMQHEVQLLAAGLRESTAAGSTSPITQAAERMEHALKSTEAIRGIRLKGDAWRIAGPLLNEAKAARAAYRDAIAKAPAGALLDAASVHRRGSSEPTWIDRAGVCGSQIAQELLPSVEPARGDGIGKSHLRWMADQLASHRLDSETKACRWLGYLQGSLVAHGLSTLEREKMRNLDSRAAAVALTPESLAE